MGENWPALIQTEFKFISKLKNPFKERKRERESIEKFSFIFFKRYYLKNVPEGI